MKSLDELKDYYRNGLKSDLKRVENKRKFLRTQYMLLAGFVVCVGLTTALLPATRDGHIWILTAFLAAIVSVIVGVVRTATYKHSFKKDIVSKLVTFLESDLSYDPTGHVGKDDFDRCKLFAHRGYNGFRGEDRVYGTLNGREIELSELRVTQKSGGKNSSTVIIFKGLFLVADAGRSFRGTTLLLPETPAMELPDGKLGELVKGLIEKFVPKPSGTKITTGDAVFDARFDIHAEDEEETLALLDAPLRDSILALAGKEGSAIRISFHDSKIFLAQESPDNLFEFKTSQSVLSYDIVEAFFRDFTRACDLVAAIPRR